VQQHPLSDRGNLQNVAHLVGIELVHIAQVHNLTLARRQRVNDGPDLAQHLLRQGACSCGMSAQAAGNVTQPTERPLCIPSGRRLWRVPGVQPGPGIEHDTRGITRSCIRRTKHGDTACLLLRVQTQIRLGLCCPWPGRALNEARSPATSPGRDACSIRFDLNVGLWLDTDQALEASAVQWSRTAERATLSNAHRRTVDILRRVCQTKQHAHDRPQLVA
jgi:hypothetical protein